MARLRDKIIRAGFETLYFSRAHGVLRSFCAGVGVILTFHHVRPARDDAFQPNGILEITPQFFEEVIVALRQSGIDLISLDDMHRRLIDQDFLRRFACITFDDGYRDNKTFAYPILKRHRVPFAIYVPSGFIDREGGLWWLTLEAVIASADQLDVVIDGEPRRFSCATAEDKQTVFSAIYWWLRALPTDDEIRAQVRALAECHGVDARNTFDDLLLTWAELAELAADPLMTVGAHTVSHPILAKIRPDTARREIDCSRKRIAHALGISPAHFSYPIGDPTSAGPREFEIVQELGFKTAVTTRPGMLFPEHRGHFMALPRVSINGDYQRMRYVEVLMSGASTALWNGFRHVNAA
jgi:peptidoglycan/xylan/chitin deacetylase (PgdA/CDA1 family)